MFIPKRIKYISSNRTSQNDKGKSLFANIDFKKDDMVLQDSGEIKDRENSSEWSIQIGENEFLDSKHWKISDFINHSCNPNLYYDFKKLQFRALKKIKIGEELTYNYLTTEWDLDCEKLSFKCWCGEKNCYRIIRGYRFLTARKRDTLIPNETPFFRNRRL